ncbi:hypothetical protein EMIT047CA2_90163 [Pseudomonas soli]
MRLPLARHNKWGSYVIRAKDIKNKDIDKWLKMSTLPNKLKT